MALKVQTTEIHLLNNDSSITDSNKFWLKVYRNGTDVTKSQSTTFNFDPNMNGSNAGKVTCETDRDSPHCGCLTAVAIGKTYLQVTYTDGDLEENIIIKIYVHHSIDKNGSDYIFYSAYNRLTTYASKSNLEGEKKFSKTFYKPTIFAKFIDSGSANSFGEITGHHYIKFQEIVKGTNTVATGNNIYLSLLTALVPGSSPAVYRNTGDFFAIKKGTDPAIPPTNYTATTHTVLRVKLNSTTSNSIDIPIRIEDSIDAPKKILEKLVNPDEKGGSAVKNRILILGEGFTSKEQFSKKCEDIRKYVMSSAPYKYLQNSLEFWIAYDPSAEEGITIPSYINIDGNKNITMIPGSFNYFENPISNTPKKFILALKELIKNKGIYDNNDAIGNSWFDNNKNAYGLVVEEKIQFIDIWKTTMPNGVVRNKDTRYGLLLGKSRLSQSDSKEVITSYNEAYLMDWTDYYNITFDKNRKHAVYNNDDINYINDFESKSIFLNEYLNSLSNENGEVLGLEWTNTNKKRFDRNFVTFVVNHPLSFGVNDHNVGAFFTNTHDGIIALSAAKSGFLYDDISTYNGTMQVNKLNTFIHELTHSFNIGDEYEDVRVEGNSNFTTDRKDYKDKMKFVNLESEYNLKVSGQLNPFNIKWNWPRIKYASLILHTPIINSSKIEVKIHKSDYNYWNALPNGEKLFLRSLEVDSKTSTFNEIGLGITGNISKNSIDVDPDNLDFYILKLNYDNNKEEEIKNQLQKFNEGKEQCCLYQAKKGLVTIEAIDIAQNKNGSGFKPSVKRKFKFKSIPKVGKYDGVEVLLDIDSEGKCKSVTLLKEKKSFGSVYLSDDVTLLNNKDQWKSYDKYFDDKAEKKYPEFIFTFKSADDSLDSIEILNQGSGYTDNQLANGQLTVTIDPNPGNTVEAEVILSNIGKSYPDTIIPPDTRFYEPIYAIVRDKRTKAKNLKGDGIKGIVTKLDANGGIEEVRLFAHGNGLYPDVNSEVEVILYRGDTKEQYITSGTQASISFDIKAYNKRYEVFRDSGEYFVFPFYSGKAEFINDWDNTQNSRLADDNDVYPYRSFFKVNTKGTGYKIPYAPLKFVLNDKALVLGYLDNDKKLSKLEIIIPGKDFVLNQIPEIKDSWKYSNAPEVNLSQKSYYKEMHPLIFQDIRKGTPFKNTYEVKSDGYYKTVLDISNNEYEYIKKDEKDQIKVSANHYFDFEWPEFKILSVDGNGGITGIGFNTKYGVEKRGRNLNYPSVGLTLILSNPTGTLNQLDVGDYGKYEVKLKYDINNLYELSKVELIKSTNFDQNRLIKLVGGVNFKNSSNVYIKVEPPSGTTSGGNIAVTCDTAINSGHVIVNLKQGKSIDKVTFKYDNISKKYKNGSGYENAPKIIISAPSISGGDTALARAKLAIYPNIMDKSILEYLVTKNSTFIAKINNSDNVDSERETAKVEILNALLEINKLKDVGNVVLDHLNIDAMKVIALFEGGGTYDNKIYRSTYDSLMRNSGAEYAMEIGFNYITMYYILSVLDPSMLGKLDEDEYFQHYKYVRLNKKII